MPTWSEIQDEIKGAAESSSPYDIVRRFYLDKLHTKTDRNTIIYYSGWLQKSELAQRFPAEFSINDNDKNGFMATVYGLDRQKGLDLILHTPGGGIDATESLVEYLRAIFGSNIRAIVPQIAMSAGTMISCACQSILMGKQSNLGPIDPQIGGLPAHGVIEEFGRAVREVAANPASIPLWQLIIGRYHPTFIGECEKAIAWSEEMVKEWLLSGMFDGLPDAVDRADKVVTELGDHALTKSHSRHISMQRARNIGLEIVDLEADHELQDLILSVHHATIQTLASTTAIKLTENNFGRAFIQTIA